MHLVVEDEAARVDDDLYLSLRPMLAVSDGQLLLMSTPFGKRGHYFREWTGEGAGWERVRVTAAECPRIKPEFLAGERLALGPRWYAQEYECNFEESESTVFSYDLIRAALSDDLPPLFAEGGQYGQDLFIG